jgi:sulfur relay (sulfurtransferase) complex TusBCD TusD component (DsrE family)
MANFLFVLSQDDNEKLTRCLQFAKIAHEKGHRVNLFFIDDGVNWADSTRDFAQATLTGDCPRDYLDYLVHNEVPVGV